MTRAAPVTVLARGAVLVAALSAAAPLAGQENLQRQIRESQLRLEQIRQERERLESEMENLRSRVRNVSGELLNIERRVTTSTGALQELTFQSEALASTVATTTGRLLANRDRLAERTAVLHERLRSIYKQGPLHAVKVLLSAESFGDLLNRYRYLHLITLHDRLLIQEVRQLERSLVAHERELKQSLEQLERLRAEKEAELDRLRELEAQHARALRQYRQRERSAQGRLQQLARDEARLTGLIDDLERRRKEEERRRAVAGAPADETNLTLRSLGSLDWPVDGSIVYRFGPERRPNGVILRYNGIGIAAPAGTPVRAVENGTVMVAGFLEGYGPSVVISHGGGYYTLYLHLQSLNVQKGQTVAKGRVVGTVGGEKTPEGPHMEFQVRAPVRGGVPEPVDPLTWLRERRSP